MLAARSGRPLYALYTQHFQSTHRILIMQTVMSKSFLGASIKAVPTAGKVIERSAARTCDLIGPQSLCRTLLARRAASAQADDLRMCRATSRSPAPPSSGMVRTGLSSWGHSRRLRLTSLVGPHVTESAPYPATLSHVLPLLNACSMAHAYISITLRVAGVSRRAVTLLLEGHA